MNIIFPHFALVPFILKNSQWRRVPDINIQIPPQDGQPFLRHHGFSYIHFHYNKKYMAPYGKKLLQMSLRNWFKFGVKLLHEMALTLAHGYFCE
jgi:hypothetical protein